MHGWRSPTALQASAPELDDLRATLTGRPTLCARASMPYGPPKKTNSQARCTRAARLSLGAVAPGLCSRASNQKSSLRRYPGHWVLQSGRTGVSPLLCHVVGIVNHGGDRRDRCIGVCLHLLNFLLEGRPQRFGQPHFADLVLPLPGPSIELISWAPWRTT